MSAFRTLEVSDPCYEREGLRMVTVKSRALEMRADVTLWAPEALPDGAPLVILLHGVYGSHWAWAWKGGAHRTAALMMENGEIGPVALAMPSDGLWGDGSGYLPHGGRDYERWIVGEVPQLAGEVLGLRTDRFFLSGLSMGGFGALRLGALYPERCSGVSAHSSLTEPDQMQPLVEEDLRACFPPVEDLGKLLIRRRELLPPLRFDCGRSDSLLAANRALHGRLKSAGVPHEYAEFDGGHDWRYWQRQFAQSLRFFHGCSGRSSAMPERERQVTGRPRD